MHGDIHKHAHGNNYIKADTLISCQYNGIYLLFTLNPNTKHVLYPRNIYIAIKVLCAEKHRLNVTRNKRRLNTTVHLQTSRKPNEYGYGWRVGVWVRERECVCVCVWERERECVCVCTLYVFMYVCMYVRTYVMYVFMYVCTYVRT
jgi:hypothetical protein